MLWRIQSRSFPQQLPPTFSLFCNRNFKADDDTSAKASPPHCAYPLLSLKAGYTAPSYPGMQVFPSLAGKPGPPRMWGHARMPLRIAPSPLTPSNDPRLGVASRYQKLHRCALDGFLGPSSKRIRLTRILQPFADSF